MGNISNYDAAKQRADEIDKIIIETLASGVSYRVEAGAGAGKTYSLEKAIDWLNTYRGRELKSRRQRVACITYTNAAVEVIKKRLPNDSSVVPTTIHSFAWDNMSYFRRALLNLVREEKIYPEEVNPDDIKEIQYTLGIKYVEDSILYLHHNDVIKLFVKLLDNRKFRHILSSRYPVILIDEYQDSFKSIMDKFILYFIRNNEPIQIGLYGDGWQTIYASNGACGIVVDDNLIEIKKESNFRSQKVIVDILNRLRPELPQIPASDENDGRAFVITCDDFQGARLGGYYKDELPSNELSMRVKKVFNKLVDGGWDKDNSRVLMLTHKLLARQQGYDRLLDLLKDDLKSNDDQLLLFFQDKVEPIMSALRNSDSKSLSSILESQRFVLNNKSQKMKWHNLLAQLDEASQKSIYDILSCVIDCRLIPIPDSISNIYNAFISDEEVLYPHSSFKTKELFDIPYREVQAVIPFLKSESAFKTEHGVKGEEYDNVMFVVGRGWNEYKFDGWMPKDASRLSDKDLNAYIRNRNLFYVCCSRPRKNLVLLVTVPITREFRVYLEGIFGAENIVSYPDFIRA